jgi:predicted small lipoprotein YifL
MKYAYLTLLAALAIAALAACNDDSDNGNPAVQHKENAALWTALGGDTGAPVAVKTIIGDAVTGLLSDPVTAPYFGGVAANTSKSSASFDTAARLEACLNLQFDSLLGGPYTYPGPVTVSGDIDAQPEMCEDMTTAHKEVGVPGCVFDEFMVDLVATLKADLPAADFAALTSTNGTYELTARNAAGIAVGTTFEYSVVPTLFNLRGTITSATPGGPLYLPPTVASSCAS